MKTLTEASNQFYDLYQAYLNFQVLLGSNAADSGNVGPVLYILNMQFERVLDYFNDVCNDRV